MADRFTLKNEIFENVRIIQSWANFSGAEGKFNRAGDRDFQIEIEDPAKAQELIAEGWNVRERERKDNPGEFWYTMKIKVNFNAKNPKLVPNIILIQNGKMTRLTEDTVGILDRIELESADLEINPYTWSMPSGETGVSAYVKNLYVTQRMSSLDAKYAEYETSEEDLPW